MTVREIGEIEMNNAFKIRQFVLQGFTVSAWAMNGERESYFSHMNDAGAAENVYCLLNGEDERFGFIKIEEENETQIDFSSYEGRFLVRTGIDLKGDFLDIYNSVKENEELKKAVCIFVYRYYCLYFKKHGFIMTDSFFHEDEEDVHFHMVFACMHEDGSEEKEKAVSWFMDNVAVIEEGEGDEYDEDDYSKGSETIGEDEDE